MPASKPARVIGEIDGIEEGAWFPSLAECYRAGLHGHNQAGIVGRADDGAESIVVSGGYQADEDHGTWLIYTGQGGRNRSGHQVVDQSFSNLGNAALRTSQIKGTPIRVIRGTSRENGRGRPSPHAPTKGYRYDGLFRVEHSWQERRHDGFLICRFLLVQVAEAGPSMENEPILGTHIGTERPKRRGVWHQRIVRSTKVTQQVKDLYDHHCQFCGNRLTIRGNGYSEGAHIRPLGVPHHGPDNLPNVLCLCPNCHVLFDGGELSVDDTLMICRGGEPQCRLRIVDGHHIDPDNLAYHRSKIAGNGAI